MDFKVVLKDAMPLLLDGTKTTIGIALISIFAGLFVGFVSCLMGISKNPVLRAISKAYVWVIRGTPMIVQAFFVFYAIPAIFKGINPSAYVAGFITLTLNAGAYLSEIIRGGILAVPVGQTEAARSLGLSAFKTKIKVVLPQAFKIAIPSMVNQFIITVKDTSILSVISLPEIVTKADTAIGKNYKFFETYILVAVFYLIIISALMVLSMYIEKRLNNDRKG